MKMIFVPIRSSYSFSRSRSRIPIVWLRGSHRYYTLGEVLHPRNRFTSPRTVDFGWCALATYSFTSGTQYCGVVPGTIFMYALSTIIYGFSTGIYWLPVARALARKDGRTDP